MSLLVGVAVLVGLLGVPVALLEAGRRFRELADPTRAAYRGAVVGYLVSIALVVGLLLRPPMIWPPPDLLEGALPILALLTPPVLGAVTGFLTAARRR